MAADARDAVRRLPEVGEVTVVLEDHYTGNGDQRRGQPRRRASPARSRARRRASSTRCASSSSARRWSHARRGCARRCWPMARPPRRSPHCGWPTCPDDPDAAPLPGAARAARASARPTRRRSCAGDGAPLTADGAAALAAAWRGSSARASRPTAASAASCCRSLRHLDRRRWRHEGGATARVPRSAQAREVDEPKAAGPFDVVVRIGAAGLCRTDLHIQEGQWAEKSEVVLPYTPGHENAGWVHEIGSGGDQRRGRRHGDRASVHLLRAVHGRAGAATTCTASTAPSPASTATAASPTSCSRARARWSSSTRRCSRPRSPRSPTRA